MTNQHPITPPPELVEKCLEEWTNLLSPNPSCLDWIATCAAQWGADQELEACCEWLVDQALPKSATALRAARRPKPPSLKEQGFVALELLKQRTTDPSIIEPLSRALEQLDD